MAFTTQAFAYASPYNCRTVERSVAFDVSINCLVFYKHLNTSSRKASKMRKDDQSVQKMTTLISMDLKRVPQSIKLVHGEAKSETYGANQQNKG